MPDLIEVEVPVGGRVMVFADVHLGVPATVSSEQVAGELARAIDGSTGPGVVVVAGDLFELIASPNASVDGVLRAHTRLRDALAAYAKGPNRQVVVLPGAHDAELAWDDAGRKVAERNLGASVALAVDLVVCTGAGTRRVRVEPGHQLDPANAFEDPRNSGESPLGHHVVREVLPLAQRAGAEWLVGVDHLIDPVDVPAFLRSRLIYRRLARRVALLFTPFVVAAVAFIGWLTTAGRGQSEWAEVAGSGLTVGGALVVIVAVGGAWWWRAVRQPIAAVGGAVTSDDAGRHRDRNRAPRRRAIDLVGEGYTGFVSGHTQEPELNDLGDGFYANVGSGGEVVERRDGRWGLPDAYAVGRRLSWLELAAGPDLSVQLRWGRQALPTSTGLERLATRPVVGGTPRPSVVGQWPDGPGFPEPADDGSARRVRVRRQASALVALIGIVDLLSAITPPLRGHLHTLRSVMPLVVPQAAAVLVVLAGISLLLLSRGLRRGQRHAWLVAEGVLVATVVLHLAKGLDVTESVLSTALAMFLYGKRRHFRARVDESSARRSLITLALGAGAAVGAGVIAVRVFGGSHRPPVGTAFTGVAQRLVGITDTALPHRVDRFLQPTLLATSIGVAAAAAWLLFRPVLAGTLDPRSPESLEAARRIVERAKGDTLAYFALRDDKRFYFQGESLVAYAVINGVALVSPDPLGPPSERHETWDGFRAYADDHGWPIAVMGAGEEWLGIYRASGMHEVYIGDEAVVDVRRFDLAGGKNKGLRQAVNRVAKKGYRAEFHDPAAIDPALEAKLRGLMTESRRGEVERGFSMTLGRIFNPDDKGLLLTVCFGPDDEPVAFCQYVPAPGIDGYSLDLMRRSEGEHPNGLTDFVVVETIRHLRETGKVGLGLNFSVMRAVLAGERGDGSLTRIQRWLLGRLGDSMQIESLWRFNAKFDPDWVPRYAAYSAPEHFLVAGLAVAEAESFWELPVIGRFFKPKAETPPSLPARPDPKTAPPEPLEPEVEEPALTVAPSPDPEQPAAPTVTDESQAG